MFKTALGYNGLISIRPVATCIWANIILVLFWGLFPLKIQAQTEDPAIIKSDSLYGKGEYTAALPILQNRLQLAQSKKEQAVQIVIFNSLGKIYSQLGKPVESLKNYQLAIKMAEAVGDKQRSGKILKNIGALYEEQKNFTQALAYYDKAEALALEIKDESLLADCYNNKGVVYEQQLNYPKALVVYKKALIIYQKLNKEDRIALTLNNIGIVYKFLNKFPEAIDYYNRSLAYSEKLGDKFFVAANLTNIGNLHALMHDYNKALEFNQRGLTIAKSIDATNIVVEALGSIAEDHAGLGNFKKAYEYRNKYLEVNNEYINLERSKQLAEMQTQYETEKKERQITELKQNQQISSLNSIKQQLLIDKKNYQIFTITFIMISLVALGYLFYHKQRIRQQRRQEKAIAETEDKERSRIAKDIHDDIGSGLSKITLIAGLANHRIQAGDAIKDEVNHISQISKDLIDNMRDLIWILNPENATLDNLVARIREYCSDYVEGLSVQTAFDIQDEVPKIKIPQQAQRNIFLTIKEALHNCIKHADCDNIFISLSYKDDMLSITITDTGIGFDAEKIKRNGNGLRNMQQRMRSIGGDFNITSIVGGGTTIETKILLT
ncbi:MAG: tetratricopeptide repeat protein [Sphingobacteriales bacterium]|nr:MAG: tetratricopeptide repeat protein [Sphingobacteriales bacterium]